MLCTLGEFAQLDVQVTDGVVADDPDTITLSIILPDQTPIPIDPGTFSHTGPGAYRYDYETTVAGPHKGIYRTTLPTTITVIRFDVSPALPIATLSGPIYASPADYREITGEAPPDDAYRRLADASELVDELLLTALYEVDTAGKPVDTALAAAFAKAVCRQVQWEAAIGDELGLSTVYPRMSIGSVTVDRGQAAAGAAAAGAWGRAAPRTTSALLNAVDSSGFPLFVGFPIVTG